MGRKPWEENHGDTALWLPWGPNLLEFRQWLRVEGVLEYCLMARLARAEVFAADEVAIVHVMNRTVRRCFLLGDDPVTGKN